MFKLTEQRFWEKVQKTDTCWLWTAGQMGKGYGGFRVDAQSSIPAHRYSYLLHKGKIPVGYHIDHLCRVRKCVNPNHLEAVTPRENLLRGNGPTAAKAGQTLCKRGHALSGSNLRFRKNGTRQCITCSNGRAKCYYYTKLKK